MQYFRRYNNSFNLAVALLDAALLSASLWLAFMVRENWGPEILPYDSISGRHIATLVDHAWLLFIIIPVWELSLFFSGVLKPSRMASLGDIAWTVVASVFIATGVFGAFAFALQLTFTSRGLIIIFTFVSAIVLTVEKCLLASTMGMVHKKNRNLVNLLVVGTGPRACEYIRNIQSHPQWGMRILGIVDNTAERVGNLIEGEKIIGQLSDIPRLLVDEVIDIVTFVVPRKWLGDIDQSLRHCQLQGVDVQVAVDLFEHTTGRIRVIKHGNLPLLALDATSVNPWQAVIKRAIDVMGSAILIIVLSAVFLAVAAIVKLGSPGPVFYRQARHGLRGREFKIIKFRTMVQNADDLLGQLLEKNEMSGAAFKIENDPRIIRFGGFLRRFSLDELPQLINVLMGDMSLVGPRPLIATEKDKYEEWQRRRMSVRPGLTCLWQINGRSTTDFDHWMALDLKYIDNCSTLTDIKIIAKTLPAIIRGRGAY